MTHKVQQGKVAKKGSHRACWENLSANWTAARWSKVQDTPYMTSQHISDPGASEGQGISRCSVSPRHPLQIEWPHGRLLGFLASTPAR